jgi:DNA-binding NtrC family response regulator
MSVGSGSRVNRVLAVAALVYAVLAIGAALHTPNLGFTWLHTGAPIFGVDDASIELRSGDRVISIDGVPTDTREGRTLGFSHLDGKTTAVLEVERGDQRLTVTVPALPGLPLDAVAGVLLALLLLLVSFVARYSLFQRITSVYVVTMAGTMLLPVVEQHVLLHVPFIVCSTLAGPATCHHMLAFPSGPARARRTLALLYAPALAFIVVIGTDALTGVLSVAARETVIALSMGWIAALLAIGSVARRRRRRRVAEVLDPILVRWINASSAVIVIAMTIGAFWVAAHHESFVGGGYRPIVALTMAGGSACILLAIARERLDAHERALRRGASALLVAGVAAALLFPILMVLGYARYVVAGSEVLVAVIGIAAFAMALLGARLQRSIDDRVAAKREQVTARATQGTIVLVTASAQTRIAKLEKQLSAVQKRFEATRVRHIIARTGRDAVIGEGLRPTFDLVTRLAPSDTTVLIIGETGVGKDVIANAVHAESRRAKQPFVVIDCSAIPTNLFEPTVFGHERGAFTGAVKSSPGLFRSADKGTVFLDEVGELPLDLQAKLLRVLQAREVVAVGSVTPVPIDVRVVAGTNRDLARMVADGQFRADLLYRLRVCEIAVPPLRARKQDIPALAERFLEGIEPRPRGIARDALELLHEYDWPGNVRELKHVLEAAALVCGDENRAADLRIEGGCSAPMPGRAWRARTMPASARRCRRSSANA